MWGLQSLECTIQPLEQNNSNLSKRATWQISFFGKLSCQTKLRKHTELFHSSILAVHTQISTAAQMMSTTQQQQQQKQDVIV